MNRYFKTISIIIPIFLFGMISLKLLNALQVATLWLLVCLTLEIIILTLFALHEKGVAE